MKARSIGEAFYLQVLANGFCVRVDRALDHSGHAIGNPSHIHDLEPAFTQVVLHSAVHGLSIIKGLLEPAQTIRARVNCMVR